MPDTDALGGNSAEALRGFIERVERLNEERKGISDDIKDVFAEAKASGFDPKIMRKAIAERKLDAQVRQEQRAVFDTYLAALGILD